MNIHLAYFANDDYESLKKLVDSIPKDKPLVGIIHAAAKMAFQSVMMQVREAAKNEVTLNHSFNFYLIFLFLDA